MTNKETDVFIISFNRLEYLKILIEWLEGAGFENIHIVDNNSTYPPLIEYLASSKHKIHRMEKNFGHLAVWDSKKFEDIVGKKYYIVSDCDVVPVDECPKNITEHFFGILEKYPKMTKIGFGMKIDDLSERYVHKNLVVRWEKKFWEKKIGDGLFDASIDTTFALYRPGIFPPDKKWWRSIRTDFPYLARHLPWYQNSSRPDEEEIYYEKSLKNKSSFWGVGDPDLLKKYNAELRDELKAVYSSCAWRILQIIYRIANIFVRGDRFRKKKGKKNMPSIEDTKDPKMIQKQNIEILAELGAIYASAGWRFLKKSRKTKD